MRLVRIGTTGETWAPNDMTGAGPAKSPGRWNESGQQVMYAAPTLAMAVLETVAHINDGGLPLNRYVIDIDVPDAVWNARAVLAATALPGGWDAIPQGMVSIAVGSAWYTEAKTALLEVPSAIIPEEPIILINATHPDAASIVATTGRRFHYSVVLRPHPGGL